MTLYFTLSALLTFLMVTLHTDTYSAIDEVLRDLGSPRIGWIWIISLMVLGYVWYMFFGTLLYSVQGLLYEAIGWMELRWFDEDDHWTLDWWGLPLYYGYLGLIYLHEGVVWIINTVLWYSPSHTES